MQKAMMEMNLQLSYLVSDITGATTTRQSILGIDAYPYRSSPCFSPFSTFAQQSICHDYLFHPG